MRDVHDIQWIGESTLHKHYDQLNLFYQEIWEQPHDYIVMNARRCFNLNHIFMQVHDGAVPDAGRIISNNALPLYAEEFARRYTRYRRFPSVLIVDDLVLHGRSLSRLLFRLEELIVAALSDSLAELGRDERYYIRRSLASAVDLYVYAENRQPLLIEDIYRQKLQCKRKLYTSELRGLSQQISSFLQKVDVPNTSYVLSYQIGSVPAPGKEWLIQDWSYRGTRHRVYLVCDPQAEDVNFLSTVRLRRAFSQKENSDLWLTSMPLFGELDGEGLSRICNRAAELLDPEEFSWLRFILRQEHPLLQKQRAQLISLILSMSSLFQFLDDSFGQKTFRFVQGSSDITKIAQNFGKSDRSLPELEKLLNGNGLIQKLYMVLSGEIRALARPFLREPVRTSCQDADCEHINNDLEDTFYNIGMASEYAAHRSISLNRYSQDSRDPSMIPLEDMLRWDVPRFHFSDPRHPVEATQKLSCMLALMDNGLMALNFECTEQDGTRRIKNMLKAGELATFSIPRRLHLIIPALALVESECWRLDFEPRAVLKQFVSTLPDQARPGPEKAWRREQAALSFLKSQGQDFVDFLYGCGQTMSGWDIRLVTSDDWMEERENSSYLSFINEETEGQEFYLNLAQRFLDRA